LSFYASKDGKISVSYAGWPEAKVVLEDRILDKVLCLNGQQDARHLLQ
jgi:hypothetical protein